MIYRYLLIFAAIVIILVALLFFLPKEQNITNYPSSGKNLIAFGDSLVSGVGATQGNDFVSILSRKLGVPIINEGRGGDTTQGALTRIDDILERDPKIVIVLLGGNDYLSQVPRDTTFKNLESIITKIQQQGAIVLLLGIRAGLFTDEFGKRYKDLASQYRAAYIPDILDGIFSHPEYMHDKIHPNDAGYAIMADRIYPVLNSLVQ